MMPWGFIRDRHGTGRSVPDFEARENANQGNKVQAWGRRLDHFQPAHIQMKTSLLPLITSLYRLLRAREHGRLPILKTVT